MFKTFRISYRLKDTYRVNTIIYALKHIPVVKHLLPNSLYKHYGLKVFANIVSVLWEMVSIFLGKILYFTLMFMLPLEWFGHMNTSSFLQLLFFLSIIGAFLNTGIFEPTKDKYYAVILMKMDGRQFVLSQYLYTLLRHCAGLLPCLFYLSIELQYPIWFVGVLTVAIVGLKLIVAVYRLNDFKKNHRVRTENNNSPCVIAFCIICLLLGYGLIFLNIVMPISILMGVFIASACLSIWGMIYIFKYPCYHTFSHQLLKGVSTLINMNTQDLVNDSYRKMMTMDTQIMSHKTGFEYFNELFMKRHKKILWRAAKRQAYIVLAATVLLIVVMLHADISLKVNIYKVLTTFLPYFVFFMYLMNTTKSVTQAMFINCDHSMLTYTFYRIPKNILKLFQIRLREMIKINLLPTVILGGGYGIVLIIGGGFHQLPYALIAFVSLISMSVFFSTHYLILYYLLQPYNAHTEMKNPVYSIIVSLTYVICFAFTKLSLPIFSFGIICIVFCVCYCIIACILVYKKAGDTFKIHH